MKIVRMGRVMYERYKNINWYKDLMSECLRANIFRPFGPQFGLKISAGGGGGAPGPTPGSPPPPPPPPPPPGPLPWIRSCAVFCYLILNYSFLSSARRRMKISNILLFVLCPVSFLNWIRAHLHFDGGESFD